MTNFFHKKSYKNAKSCILHKIRFNDFIRSQMTYRVLLYLFGKHFLYLMWKLILKSFKMNITDATIKSVSPNNYDSPSTYWVLLQIGALIKQCSKDLEQARKVHKGNKRKMQLFWGAHFLCYSELKKQSIRAWILSKYQACHVILI